MKENMTNMEQVQEIVKMTRVLVAIDDPDKAISSAAHAAKHILDSENDTESALYLIHNLPDMDEIEELRKNPPSMEEAAAVLGDDMMMVLAMAHVIKMLGGKN